MLNHVKHGVIEQVPAPRCSVRAFRVFLGLMLFLSTSLQSSVALSKEASEADLKKLKHAISQTQANLKRFRGKESTLTRSLREAEVSIGELSARINQVQTQLQEQQKQLNQLNSKRKKLQQSKKQQEELIGQHIAAAYKLGRQKKLKVLLNQEKPEKLSRAMTYYDYINKARAQHISEYENTLDELDQIEPRIMEAAQALNQSRETLRSEHERLNQQQAQRKIALNGIKHSISGATNRIKRLERDQKELEKLLSAVEETIANIRLPNDYRPFKALQGKLPWPIKGTITNHFGQKRPDSQLRWQGITLVGKEGHQVKAIHHGRVVFADWFIGKGLLIIIDHGSGYMSLYAHNQSLLKEPGEWIAAGESIATVGNSGGLSHAGLYFEIRNKGKPQNPKNWCRKS
jgi:septal ring factor EnvC (AmiA/AmiB activator)